MTAAQTITQECAPKEGHAPQDPRAARIAQRRGVVRQAIVQHLKALAEIGQTTKTLAKAVHLRPSTTVRCLREMERRGEIVNLEGYWVLLQDERRFYDLHSETLYGHVAGHRHGLRYKTIITRMIITSPLITRLAACCGFVLHRTGKAVSISSPEAQVFRPDQLRKLDVLAARGSFSTSEAARVLKMPWAQAETNLRRLVLHGQLRPLPSAETRSYALAEGTEQLAPTYAEQPKAARKPRASKTAPATAPAATPTLAQAAHSAVQAPPLCGAQREAILRSVRRAARPVRQRQLVSATPAKRTPPRPARPPRSPQARPPLVSAPLPAPVSRAAATIGTGPAAPPPRSHLLARVALLIRHTVQRLAGAGPGDESHTGRPHDPAGARPSPHSSLQHACTSDGHARAAGDASAGRHATRDGHNPGSGQGPRRDEPGQPGGFSLSSAATSRVNPAPARSA